MEMTKNDLKNKLTSPEEAVKLVHDHDRIFIGLVSNITPVLSDALWERRHELNDITIISGLLLRPTRLYTEPAEKFPSVFPAAVSIVFSLTQPIESYWN